MNTKTIFIYTIGSIILYISAVNNNFMNFYLFDGNKLKRYVYLILFKIDY
jgi:hypothetical protein